MDSSMLILASGLLLATGAAWGAQSDFAPRIVAQDGWVAWHVPLVAGTGAPCCYEFHAGHASNTVCDLDSRSWNVGTKDDGPGPAVADELVVYAHVARGEIDKLRAYGATCPLRNTEQVRRLDAVAPADSVALLAGVAAHAGDDIIDSALAALALHAEAGATTALEQLADSTHQRHLREQALFWLAQERGIDGATFVERVATSDADPELRAQAVFDLSEAHGIDAYASIHRIARHDASEHVREQALFWMAQMGDARAKDDIVVAIAADASDAFREQAVFALSQLKDSRQADAALIALVRGNYPRSVKQHALFWLGQSGSDAALQFLDEVLSRTTSASSG